MTESFPTEAEVVIIGGGVIGTVINQLLKNLEYGNLKNGLY